MSLSDRVYYEKELQKSLDLKRQEILKRVTENQRFWRKLEHERLNKLYKLVLNTDIEFKIQGSLVEFRVLKYNLPPQVNNTTRGLIKEFSQKSRVRLLKMINTVNFDKSGKVVFLTLTYGQQFPTARDSKEDLRKYFQLLKRKFPRISFIWRMELQERGAPHYHLIIFNMPFVKKEKIQKWWAFTISKDYWDYSKECVRFPFTRIELINGRKKLINYVAKYVAKETETYGDCPQDTAERNDSGDSGFNITPYLHVLGRSWGIKGRKHLIFHLISVIRCRFGQWFLDLFCSMYEYYPYIEFFRNFHLYFNDGDFYRVLLKVIPTSKQFCTIRNTTKEMLFQRCDF